MVSASSEDTRVSCLCLHRPLSCGPTYLSASGCAQFPNRLWSAPCSMAPPTRLCLLKLHSQPAVNVCSIPYPPSPLGSLFILPLLLAELDLQRALSLQVPPVKEGPLFIHRTKGKGPLMSSSFKKLYFSLTTEALSFAKTPSSKVGKEGGRQVGLGGVVTPWGHLSPQKESQGPSGSEKKARQD